MLENTVSRLTAFAGALALVGAGAVAVGASTDATPPLQDCLKVAAAEAGLDAEAMSADTEAGHGGEPMIEAVPGADGLASELAGLEMVPEAAVFSAGSTGRFRFRILDCEREPVREFVPEQGKLLHLIVVRTDATEYQHLHPTLDDDGTFSTDLETPRAGRYRAIADFVIDDRKYVVSTTIAVPGRASDRPLPPPALRARTGGYDVELQRPALLEAGEEAQLTFRITRHGRPVTELEPYLGAYGHLVALRAPDLAYSHVHPNGEDRSAGALTFDTELDEPGMHRLFLQFQIDGRVHTVAFTQAVS